MNLSHLVSTVFRASAQTSVLIVIVVGIQRVFSSKIPAAWRYALWLPVIIRLLLPIAPESRFSLFNLFTRTQPAASRSQVTVKSFAPRMVEAAIPDEPFPVVQQESISSKPSAMQIASGVWLAFATALMLRWSFANWRFGRALARSQTVCNERIYSVFEEARKDLSVTSKVSLVEHQMIGSPALFGAIRPRLLLPTGLGDKFSDRELRHIFLHELAHIKRGDLYVNWVLVVLQALHWFNPLVWFACRRMRCDREFGCDEIALQHLQGQTPEEFGETLLKILQSLSSSPRAIGAMSIVANKAELKRRLRMIGDFQPGSRKSILWATLLLAICATGLSDPRTKLSQPEASVKLSDQTNLVLNAEEIPARKSLDESRATDLYSSTFKSNPERNPPSSIEDVPSPIPDTNRSNSYIVIDPSKPAPDRTFLTHDAKSDSAFAKDLQPRMPDQNSRLTGAPLISNLLETIILPEFSVPVETPLSEIIKSLGKEVRERDPQRRGLNFLITSEVPARPGPDDPEPVGNFKIKISPPLKNARVVDVLEAVKNGAIPRGEIPTDRLLSYSIEPYAVVFTSSAVNTLYSRTFKLNSESFLKAVRNRLQSDHSISTKSNQEEVREFFEGVGLQFPKSDPLISSPFISNPPRKAIFFNEKTGVLLVRATLNEIDLIEEVVHQTQPKAGIFQMKLTMRVTETKSGSRRSAVELVSDEVASFSKTPLEWKTNTTENSAAVISAIINDQDSKALFKFLEKRGEYHLMTTHEFTIPSGSEAAVSIGGDFESTENKGDVHLIPTVLDGDNLVLSVGFQRTDSGRVSDPDLDLRHSAGHNTFALNAIGYVTRKIFTSTRFSAGQTLILSVPRTFRDGRDMLLFIRPQNLGAEVLIKP